jgi:hypothetical protein
MVLFSNGLDGVQLSIGMLSGIGIEGRQMNGQDRYEEHTAVEALSKKIPKKFATAYLPRQDMPDIRVKSASIGVEVVIGENETIQRILRMNKQVGRPEVKNPVEALKRMGINSGYHIVEQDGKRMVLPDAYWGSGNDIEKAIKSKVNKANAYTRFDENDLFVHVTDARDEIGKTVSVIQSMQEMPFDFIYLWDGRELVEIQTSNGNYNVY